MTTVSVITDRGTLDRHADDWNDLASAEQGFPVNSHAWVSAYIDHRLRPPERWMVILAHTENRLVGVLPLVVTPAAGLASRSVTLSTPQDEHTPGCDCLVQENHEEDVVPLLINAAFQSEPRVLRLEMKSLPEGSPALLSQAGRGTLSLFAPEGFCSFIPVKGEADEFFSSLSRNFRRNLKKAENKLAALPGTEAAFLQGDEETGRNLSAFLQVEQAGWKGLRGTAIARSPELAAFYKTLTARLREAGWLEYHFLRADSRPIAAFMGVRVGRRVTLTKIGYDEDYARMAPGNLLMKALLLRCFERQDTDEINLVTDMEWHNLWNAEKRRYRSLRLYRRGPRGVLLGLVPQWARMRLSAAANILKTAGR